MDWQRGKIPFFVPPPGFNENTGEKVTDVVENEKMNTNEEEIAQDENKKMGIDQNLKDLLVTNKYDGASGEKDQEMK